MRGIVWLDAAVNDVVRLRDFIARKNPSAAKKAAEAIQNAVQHLMEMPAIGKPIQDLPSYQDLFIRFGAGGYVLRYRIHAETIYIVYLRHYRESDSNECTGIPS